jgi:hypothetical protein
VGRHQRHQAIAQEFAARHPLEVVAAAVVVGAVQPALGELRLQPPEQLLVAHVHAQRDLGLPAVASEVPLTRQQAEQVADGEVAGGRRLHDRRLALPCFTVKFHVEPSRSGARSRVSPSC